MISDHREARLRTFRIVCRLCSALMLLFALFYSVTTFGTCTWLISLIGPSTDELLRSHINVQLALFALNVLQVFAISAFMAVVSFGNPFRPASSRLLLLLAALMGLKGLVTSYSNYWIAENSWLTMIASIEPSRFALAQSIDVSSFVMCALFVLLSFLFRYGQELFIDSSEVL